MRPRSDQPMMALVAQLPRPLQHHPMAWDIGGVKGRKKGRSERGDERYPSPSPGIWPCSAWWSSATQRRRRQQPAAACSAAPVTQKTTDSTVDRSSMPQHATPSHASDPPKDKTLSATTTGRLMAAAAMWSTIHLMLPEYPPTQNTRARMHARSEKACGCRRIYEEPPRVGVAGGMFPDNI